MGIASEIGDAVLLLLGGLVKASATTPAEASLCTTDGFVILKVAVGEGVYEGRVSAETGADELGRVGSSVCSEMRAVLGGRDAEGLELLDTVTDLG